MTSPNDNKENKRLKEYHHNVGIITEDEQIHDGLILKRHSDGTSFDVLDIETSQVTTIKKERLRFDIGYDLQIIAKEDCDKNIPFGSPEHKIWLRELVKEKFPNFDDDDTFEVIWTRFFEVSKDYEL